MDVCEKCGNPIEFRYIDGRCVPLHTNGSCIYEGAGSGVAAGRAAAFQSIESYVNPNARCPVCRASVFFYQSPAGGRVFFDDLGWPWPKHNCTDTSGAQRLSVAMKHPKRFPTAFRNKAGDVMEIFTLAELVEERGGRFLLRLKSVFRHSIVQLAVDLTEQEAGRLSKEDFVDAPSFVISRSQLGRKSVDVEFVCARLKHVIRAQATRL